jgi:hypothetical protein
VRREVVPAADPFGAISEEKCRCRSPSREDVLGALEEAM